MKRTVIELYDTTLRDGAQMRGIDFSLADKQNAIKELDRFGIQFIEAGWYGGNPVDTELFERLKGVHLENATLVTFGMTCRKSKKPEEDKFFVRLISAGTDVIALVGKASKFQVEHILQAELEENLRMIRESCAFLTERGKAVFFEAEHFFDGFKEDSGYALACLNAAADGGAIRLVFCDTNGGTLPLELGQAVSRAKKETQVLLGIHSHNDSGMAVANSIAAVECGAVQVQGTINGFGERCGNADLCSVIANLQLKKGVDCVLPHQLASLAELSKSVYRIARVSPDACQPFVGENAFCHKGGMHGDGHLKHPASYRHIDPKLVGNSEVLAFSGLSGKAVLKAKAQEFGIELSPEELDSILVKAKEFEAEGFKFDGADASLELFIARHMVGYSMPFEILRHRVVSEQGKNGKPKDEALLRVRVNGAKKVQIRDEWAQGSGGPLSVLDSALRKAIRYRYGKAIKDVSIAESGYSVRVVSGRGVSSLVQVSIPFFDGKRTWTTAGCSRDSIGANCRALSDGLEYAILKAR